MDYDRIYRQQVKILADMLQMPSRQELAVVIVTGSQENASGRLTRYWMDLNQTTVYFHEQIFNLRQPDLEQRFFRFAALFSFFPPAFFEHTLLFHGSWLWHFAAFLHIPEMAPLIYDANRHLQEMLPNFPFLINASMLFSLIDLDYYYTTFLPQIIPILNETLSDAIIMRIFSNVTLYSIAKSLRIQNIHNLCNDPALKMIGRYRIEYSHFGLTVYYCIAFAAPLTLHHLITIINKNLVPLFPIVNLNIYNRVMVCYILIPPLYLDSFTEFFRMLQTAGYLDVFQITPVAITQYIQFDPTLPPHTSITRLLEFNSLQIYTFRNINKWRHNVQQIHVKPLISTTLTYPASALPIAFLYNLCIIHPADQAAINDRFIYDQYVQFAGKSAVSYEDFLRTLTQLRTNETLTLDRYSLIHALRSFPYVLNCQVMFPCLQPYLSELLGQYNETVTDSHWCIASYLSTFFFPFWLAQFYWNSDTFLIYQIFPISKALDYTNFALRYDDLQKGKVIKSHSLPPINLVHPFFPIIKMNTPLTTPISVRTMDVVLKDLQDLRSYVILYDELYSMAHVRSHKLDAFFTEYFSVYFHLEAPFQYLDPSCWQAMQALLSEILNGNRPHIKQFLTVAMPLQRVLPRYIQTHRILVLLSGYLNLHPDYLLHDEFLHGMFQWGLLSCHYQTSNTMSIVLLEYDLPQTIYENPKSQFHRFWSDCRHHYPDQLHIIIEPILLSRYACMPQDFATHQLLLRSFSLKNLTACELCINPNDMTYNYAEDSSPIEVSQHDLLPYLRTVNGDTPPPPSLALLPIWWRESGLPEFFLMTLGALRVVFLVQKNEIWSQYRRHIINFCQQFPAMTVTETSSIILLELHITGLVRETTAFVISQFTSIQLNFDLLLPVDARMYSSKDIQTLLKKSRHEYFIQLVTGERVEEPLYHAKTHQTLYTLSERLRMHNLLRQLVCTYPQQITLTVWRQWMQCLDTIFPTNPPSENDLLIYHQLEAIVLHPPKET